MDTQELGKVETPSPTEKEMALWSDDEVLANIKRAYDAEQLLDRRIADIACQKAALAFRQGRGYKILRDRYKPKGEWMDFQKKHLGNRRTNIDRYIKVYLRCEDEAEAATFKTLDELYIAKGIIRIIEEQEPEQAAAEEDSDFEAAEAAQVAAQQPAPVNVTPTITEQGEAPKPVIYGADGLPANRPAPGETPTPACTGVITRVEGEPGPSNPGAPGKLPIDNSMETAAEKAMQRIKDAKASGNKPKSAKPKPSKKPVYNQASLRKIGSDRWLQTLKGDPNWLSEKVLTDEAVKQLSVEVADALEEIDKQETSPALQTPAMDEAEESIGNFVSLPRR